MTRLFAFAFALLLLLLTAACSGSSSADSAAVPRPTAYPRPALYDTLYSANDALPLGFEVNSHARLTVMPRADFSVWADIDYPAYNAAVHCTFTPVDSTTIAEVVDNRTQRMALNIGAGQAEQIKMQTPEGFSAVILTAQGPSLTPLQFIAAGNDMVVSGALQIADADAPIDSIRPMIQAVRADIIHAINHLH